MTGEQRRKEILACVMGSSRPVSASQLSKQFSVSRQVIVQDVALLRAGECNITSTSRGYIVQKASGCKRIFKVCHSEADTREELQTIVDCGGSVVDVFVNHRAYGVISAPMSIRSRLDIDEFMKSLETGKSTFLMNITSGYHFHTVEAPSEQILDIIGSRLEERHFLAPVLDYEKSMLKNKD
jgi:Predicted small molecule binding protein (contains 3H domain)